MNKRITSLALAVASIPAALALTASPAAAQSAPAECGAYPAGQAYGLRVSPAYARVAPGAVVRLSTRLFRGREVCEGERVGFYLRGRGRALYVLTQNQNPVTDINGLRAISVTARDDFRYYSNFNTGPRTIGARSATGLVQVRR